MLRRVLLVIASACFLFWVGLNVLIFTGIVKTTIIIRYQGDWRIIQLYDSGYWE